MKIKSSQLADAVMKELENFRDIEVDELKEAIEEVAAETVQDLKVTSPKKSGKYSKGWRKKKTYENAVKKRVTIHNTNYRLPHLLENGHAKRGGGRVEGITHIAPAEEKAISRLERRLESKL